MFVCLPGSWEGANKLISVAYRQLLSSITASLPSATNAAATAEDSEDGGEEEREELRER
jgi:hypothetical protein